MEPCAAVGCVNIGSLTSALPVIPYQKLTDLYYLSRGGFGTVFKAQHSDWRTTVAIKCLKLDCPVGERERNYLLKEAEVLHKARFNYIIQIFGICNEPEFFCLVTEFMINGSLDLLLHEKDMYPGLAWPLRLRILYEIALGVNFLHNMNPPLLHQDLKTQNILLDGEFHVKLSVSKGSGSKPTEMGGTVIYMPPEKYEPCKNRRADVKHDMYSLPADIPSRETLISLMTCGWTTNPDERPSFLECLIELEPMRMQRSEKSRSEDGSLSVPNHRCWPESSGSGSGSCSSQDTEISLPGALTSRNPAPSKVFDAERLPSSFLSQTLEPPKPLKDDFIRNNLNGDTKDVNNPTRPPGLHVDELETKLVNLTVKLQPQPQQQEEYSPPLRLSPPSQGPFAQWIATRREDIVSQMTEACLNQCLDALLAGEKLMREDYELVVTQTTRTAKVRKLLDYCPRHWEDFCCIVVRKLRDNRQMGLQPYPPELSTPSLVPSAPPLSMSFNIPRNV
ncbi:Receptor-interacting serine/threonine-protein kinase 2 [Liparis tanakae]|uniref:Receptor-interacting serine/threonine-protein kinase 2 n=1 Tax=Liparis tanakae TaxID=230148 RepID=A0A4Z2HVM3_9TELE|nr:Receptor-interacting serine/threonine-protein kinase 2 [Liparis tanakae]